MAERWAISDQHYGHDNILKFTDEAGNRIRPFSNVHEMDECMITRHNELVKDGDEVYMLGDFVWGKRNAEGRNRFHNVCAQLKGTLRLLPGNHDDIDMLTYTSRHNLRIENFNSWWRVEHGGAKFIFCHYPLHVCNLRYEMRNKGVSNGWAEFYNVHGHIHQRRVLTDEGLPDPRYINVCVEHTDYAPLNFDELLK